jgi:DNA-binding beta-propeller fold protein YncE
MHRKRAMSKLALCCALALTACAADGGGDDDVPPGTEVPPWYNGVSTLTGAADAGSDDGARGVARLNNPVNVAYHDGVLYVADFDNSKIRRVDPETGSATTLSLQPNFRKPFAMVFDGSTLYVTTDTNSTSGQQGPMTGSVWKIVDGTATMLAENIGRPRGIAVLDGKLVVSDYQHHTVSSIDKSSGVVTPIAGIWDGAGMADGAASMFSVPYGMAVLDGKVIVADQNNHRIRAIDAAGTVTTIAGSGTAGFADGPAATAQLNKPQGISVVDGVVYFTDLGNCRVRRIAGGNVETVAGTAMCGFADGDDRLATQFYGLEGLVADPDGSRVYVADGNRGDGSSYNRVRRIELP